MATEIVNPAAVGAASVPAPGAAPGAPGQATKGSSLWVGELAADVNESKLYEFFNPIAAVQSVRVCRHSITRESLGYAYVNFQTPADAEAAMEQRNYSELNGKVIRIMWAQRDPLTRRSNVGNIVVKKLPATFTDRQLHDIFKDFGNILSVKVARDSKGASKGYGFVHFDSDRAAKDAIEVTNGMDVAGSKAVLQVEHFVARNQRQSAPDKWNNLFIKNVPKSYSEDALKAVFAPFGSITSAVIMRDESGVSKGFGFVCFADHEGAAKAVDSLNDKEVDTLPNLTPEDVAAANRVESKGEAESKDASSGPKPKVKLYVGRALKKSERERMLKEKLEAAKRERQAKYHGCNLYVRNLDDSVDDEALRKEFSPFGTIVSAKVSKEADGRSRGHGFVCFETPEAASKAQSAMHRKLVASKPLFVALWEPKEARQARYNASQAQGPRPGRGAPQGMPGQAAQGFGGNQQQAAMAAMLMQPQMLMQSMLSMAMSNPAMFESLQRMGAQGMQQFMQAYMSNMQTVLRNAGQGMPAGANAMSPTAAGAAGARGPAGFPQRGNMVMGGMGGFMGGQGAPGAMGGPRGPRGQRVGAPAPAGTAPGAVGVARGPQPGSPGARGPVGQGMPAGAQGARGPVVGGPRPTGPAMGMPAMGPRPGMPTQAAVVAANMQYRPADGARNMPGMGMGMVPGMVDPATAAAMGMQMPTAGATPAAPAQTRENFVQQLASIANPQQRKAMIGEHLYTQVHARNPDRAGKITGMLLDGMEDSELLNLLETPSELESRIAEALEVLEQHKRTTGTA